MLEHTEYAAYTDALSEGWGNANNAPKDIEAEALLQKAELVAEISYTVIHEEMATGEGMPEPGLVLIK